MHGMYGPTFSEVSKQGGSQGEVSSTCLSHHMDATGSKEPNHDVCMVSSLLIVVLTI